jgi:4-carboxymuconolactone decarboxylase
MNEIDRGAEMYEKVLGKSAPASSAEKPLSGLREIALRHLFGSIWSRPGLSIRDRRMITIALLAAQGRSEQLRDHVRGARLGEDKLTGEEILEMMIHVAHYAGWAAGTNATSIAQAVLDELET